MAAQTKVLCIACIACLFVLVVLHVYRRINPSLHAYSIVCGLEGTCGNRFTAIVFFISAFTIGSCVFLNILIAVILDNYFENSKEDESKVTGADVDKFGEIWSDYDPDADTFVPVEEVRR